MLSDLCAVPELPGVYVLSPFFRRVITASSQQAKAFTLIGELNERPLGLKGQSVVVVGAGFAGLSATVAAASLGAETTLVESASDILPQQRGCTSRFLHPNILDWPRSSFSRTRTSLPFLNWTANSADLVVREVELEFERLRRHYGFEVLTNHIASGILPSESGLNVHLKRRNSIGVTTTHLMKQALVICCVGFGKERFIRGVPFSPYWRDNSLHQPTPNRSRRTTALVIGRNDGGLVDCFRLRLKNFVQASLATDLGLDGADCAELRMQLLNIEGQGLPEEELAVAYSRLNIPGSVLLRLEHCLRGDTHVTLVAPASHPLSKGACILNRLVLSLLHLHDPFFRFFPGSANSLGVCAIDERRAPARRNNLQFSQFDTVITRIGPSWISSLFPSGMFRRLREKWQSSEPSLAEEAWQGFAWPVNRGEQAVVISSSSLNAYHSVGAGQRLEVQLDGSVVVAHRFLVAEGATLLIRGSGEIEFQCGLHVFGRIEAVGAGDASSVPAGGIRFVGSLLLSGEGTIGSTFVGCTFFSSVGTFLIQDVDPRLDASDRAKNRLPAMGDGDGRNCGGAVCLLATQEIRFVDCLFSNCASERGGAIFVDHCEHVEFLRCAFVSNSSRGNSRLLGSGGAVFLQFSTVVVRQCVFEKNTATDELSCGGAIYIGLGCRLVRIERTTFSHNDATNAGGAVYARKGNISMPHKQVELPMLIEFVKCNFIDNTCQSPNAGSSLHLEETDVHFASVDIVGANIPLVCQVGSDACVTANPPDFLAGADLGTMSFESSVVTG